MVGCFISIRRPLPFSVLGQNQLQYGPEHTVYWRFKVWQHKTINYIACDPNCNMLFSFSISLLHTVWLSLPPSHQSSVFILQWIQPVVKLPLRILSVSKPAIISLSQLYQWLYLKSIPAWEMGTQLLPETESGWCDSVNKALFGFQHEKNTFPPIYTHKGAREAPSVWTDGLCCFSIWQGQKPCLSRQ